MLNCFLNLQTHIKLADWCFSTYARKPDCYPRFWECRSQNNLERLLIHDLLLFLQYFCLYLSGLNLAERTMRANEIRKKHKPGPTFKRREVIAHIFRKGRIHPWRWDWGSSRFVCKSYPLSLEKLQAICARWSLERTEKLSRCTEPEWHRASEVQERSTWNSEMIWRKVAGMCRLF